jgi:hypothetical protein
MSLTRPSAVLSPLVAVQMVRSTGGTVAGEGRPGVHAMPQIVMQEFHR